MRRILHIIDSLERGGAETLLINTVETIQIMHPEVQQYVVTLYKPGELEKNIPEKVQFFNLSLSKPKLISALYRLRSYIKKNKIEIVHSHLIHSTLIARIALPKGVKLVTTYHSVFYDPNMVTYAKVELPIDRFTYKEDYFTIYVSDAVKENISRAVGIKKNQIVLPNFASAKFSPVYKFNPDQHLQIVMVGNLHEIKNHEIAIRALGRLKELPISLDIYGDGDLRPFLENLIQETQANVKLKGKVSMSSDILREYDLFMMTSHHEGMPLAILEAMQSGLPSLLNDLPMLRETAGEAAIYYDYDDLTSLVYRIKGVYENKLILEKLAQQALIRSEKFSANGYISKLFQIYDQLIKF